MILNSSKLSKPSPFKSNCLIIALQSSRVLDSPIFLSILFKLFGVIKPHPSLSYISKATFKSFNFCSSPPLSMRATKSSKLSNPSPSESKAAIAISASFIRSSPPIIPNPCFSSEGETFPSPSSSKYLRTSSKPTCCPISHYTPWTKNCYKVH
ncbi:hypothetical protein PHAVU_009G167200 [Phaseolus vulgaris]|uniref:Uncharacterized protein n=1 Tax=Phaseolus vulgaris TaxID=3885 RepID=V7AW97_PHAVU|nr:hypothetical protein PHAVU_009G167200g [Phaseolus vulgaris]ESW09922.1 hypothetical protein PHAVU_009G167200g [Phaseolus vulgaris]